MRTITTEYYVLTDNIPSKYMEAVEPHIEPNGEEIMITISGYQQPVDPSVGIQTSYMIVDCITIGRNHVECSYEFGVWLCKTQELEAELYYAMRREQE